MQKLQVQPQVGLVGSVEIHALLVGERGQWADVDTDRAEDMACDFLAQVEHIVLRDERHLDIDLRELGLAVGAQVLVTQAAGDLVVALDAGDHKKLLEKLRRLRQRVERAGLGAGRDDVVARAFRRRPHQQRRLDLDEAALVEEVAAWRAPSCAGCRLPSIRRERRSR